MEWVETTGKTVEEALDAALDQLGVDADEVEYEVLEEPKSGLFGRVRSEARIRARVRPTKPRAKTKDGRRKSDKTDKAEKADKPAKPEKAAKAAKETKAEKPAKDDKPAKATKAEKSDKTDKTAAGAKAPKAEKAKTERAGKVDTDKTKASGKAGTPESVDAEVEAAGRRFLEGLLESFGLEATIDCVTVAEDTVEFRVLGADLGVLIGPKAATLLAVQDLLRTFIHYESDVSAGRVMLDVAGYREKRRVALQAFTEKVAADVLATGERRALEPMSAADRKVVHDAANEIAGIATLSEGEEPNRRVILLPA